MVVPHLVFALAAWFAGVLLVVAGATRLRLSSAPASFPHDV
jgi:hypothetical protein